mmetsp:Transcript_37768/g.61782  ORF Transcript_37768/g.61782 Transcript_37768/m.61782 type:complete len:655 (+) Transcript_37768:395-2359(+)
MMPRTQQPGNEGKFNQYFLGRGTKSDFTSSDKRVSNVHCSIYCTRSGEGGRALEVWLEDSSVNGTWLNGGQRRLRKGERHQLQTGDEICLINPNPSNHNMDFAKAEQDIKMNSLTFTHLAARSLAQRTKAKTLFRTKTGSVDRTRRLTDLYDKREMLGTGTSGKVYRVIEQATGREFAVKIMELKKFRLLPGLSKEELIQEALMMKQISHPFIVNLKDLFQTDTQLQLVMDLVKGGDLFDRVVDKGRFSEREAREVFYRILVAVQYLHSEDICHRDLKPENILMVHKDPASVDIKITDFGLAKKTSVEGLKTFCGTPQYFAPEVLKRRGTVAGVGRYGMESDMWSLGVILYVILSGTMPFQEEVLYNQIEQGTYSLDTDDFEGVSDEAKALVRALLNVEPAARLSADQALKHPWLLRREDGMGINFSQPDAEPHSLPPPDGEAGAQLRSPTAYETDGGSESEGGAARADSGEAPPPLPPPPPDSRKQLDMAPPPPGRRASPRPGTNFKELALQPAVNPQSTKTNSVGVEDIQEYSSDEEDRRPGRKKIVVTAPDHRATNGRGSRGKKRGGRQGRGNGAAVPGEGGIKEVKGGEKFQPGAIKPPTAEESKGAAAAAAASKKEEQEPAASTAKRRKVKNDKQQQKLTQWMSKATSP